MLEAYLINNPFLISRSIFDIHISIAWKETLLAAAVLVLIFPLQCLPCVISLQIWLNSSNLSHSPQTSISQVAISLWSFNQSLFFFNLNVSPRSVPILFSIFSSFSSFQQREKYHLHIFTQFIRNIVLFCSYTFISPINVYYRYIL